MKIKSLLTGKFFDLSPDSEFAVTIENPMFADDRIPVAVSTGIEFPLTATNKEAFGFVETMMLSPKNQKIPVVVLLGGIEIFTGQLEFDEYADKVLKYTFVAVETNEVIAGNIYDIECEDYSDVQFATFVKNARKGLYSDVGLPMIVRQPNSAKVEYVTTDAEDCSIIDKYANYLYTDQPYVVPAVRIGYLLKKIIPSLKVPTEIAGYIDKMAILGTYKPEEWQGERYGLPLRWENATPPNRGSVAYCKKFNVAETLPDMTSIDLVANLLKMFCATLFVAGQGYEIRMNRSIISDKKFTDWTQKVSDIYTLVAGEETSYTLNYANENSTYTPAKVDDLGQAEIDSSVQICWDYSEMIQKFLSASEYINVQIESSRNIYSGKAIKARLYYHYEGRKGVVYNDLETTIPTIDIVYQAGIEKKTVNNAADSKGYENNIAFNCAKCIPANVATPILEGSTNAQVTLISVSPIVDFPTVGADRPSVAYIGLLLANNLLDQGNIFTGQYPYISAGIEETNNLSIAIGGAAGLYEKFHKEFAEWYVKKRNTIKAEVYLTPADVANLRLWQKIMIYNRLFFIKTIELTISDNMDIVFAMVEFVEA